jgi:quinol monooxygenase YgiN
MSIVTVVAKVTAKSDVIEAVKAELIKLIEPTRQEDGCIEYRLHQDNDDPSVFVFYESWQSLACLEQHTNSQHFQSYVAAVGNLITDKDVHKMTETV